MKRFIPLFALCLCLCVATGCKHDAPLTELDVVGGKLNKMAINALTGFSDYRASVLANTGVSEADFIQFSTDSAWSLPPAAQEQLKAVRAKVQQPGKQVLIQKFIPLEEMATYLTNKYGGTVGGFVAWAADVKNLNTMQEVYRGMRLDYDGTKFSEQGIGYAAIRFYSEQPQLISIPYCPEMGGSQAHAWPNGGGGFTTSSLTSTLGGIPEWTFSTYVEPTDGAELYEMNANGYEILRGVFYKDTKWVMVDKGYAPTTKSRATTQAEPFVQQTVYYKGHPFFLRGTFEGICHLTTFTPYHDLPLEVVEKGVWGIQVPKAEVEE